MLITESRLKQIIQEEMGALEAEKLQDMSPEGPMVRDQLLNLAEYAAFLADNMPENAQLEPWIQSKITLASDYISKVKHHLDAEMGGGCGGEEEMPIAVAHIAPVEEET
tara:strand:- start:1296 stop:1622 length:327 start_codon:yes stop_codon:yes gene_type:complete